MRMTAIAFAALRETGLDYGGNVIIERQIKSRRTPRVLTVLENEIEASSTERQSTFKQLPHPHLALPPHPTPARPTTGKRRIC